MVPGVVGAPVERVREQADAQQREPAHGVQAHEHTRSK
jgi:hypothetical protein